jgi:protein ImuB
MPLAEAQGLVPRGHFLEHDAETDRDILRQLAWECQRFTPRAGMDESPEPDSLFLDVSGCEHLYGDVYQLGEIIARHFGYQGYRIHGAIAPTWGAAYSLARQSALRDALEIVSPEQLRSRLAAVPIVWLRLPLKALSMLAECGLRTIGQLWDLPRSSLPSRFGPQVLLRLDQALGEVEEILTPQIPTQPCLVRRRWEFPLREMEAIDLALQLLLQQLVDELHRRQAVTQEIRVIWSMDSGETPTVRIRLLKSTDSMTKLWELLSLRRERLSFVGGVCGMEIEATPGRPELVRRTTLFEQDETRDAELTHLIERLSHRLGEDAVLRYRLLPEAQPELAQRSEPWLTGGRREELSPRGRAVASEGQGTSAPLPLRLLPSPERVMEFRSVSSPLDWFRWRGREYRVTSCSWPQRIETGWWREKSVHRDYFRVETEQGTRLWIFRDLRTPQWSVHGLFE